MFSLTLFGAVSQTDHPLTSHIDYRASVPCSVDYNTVAKHQWVLPLVLVTLSWFSSKSWIKPLLHHSIMACYNMTCLMTWKKYTSLSLLPYTTIRSISVSLWLLLTATPSSKHAKSVKAMMPPNVRRIGRLRRPTTTTTTPEPSKISLQFRHRLRCILFYNKPTDLDNGTVPW